jgi:hypothetical protein
MCHHLDRPKDFAKRIHQALRAWHALHAKDTLANLRLVQRAESEQGAATPRLISNQILLDGLERLKPTNAQGAELLRRRFHNQETALEIAHSWNVSEDIIFQWQRAAIDQLAEIIWQQELELGQQRLRQVEARLEPPTYDKLFGVEQKKAEVCKRLETGSAPWLLALEGLGGVGKTSLADALARELACQIHFRQIGWMSARRRFFQLPGEIKELPNQPALTLAELVDRLIDQFELTGLKRQADTEKLAGLKDFLKSQPCLVVVDNLETAADYRALVPQLKGLASPSKFLLTTRHVLRDMGGVYGLTLTHLPRADTLALIRYEAETAGLSELAEATETELGQIYEITSGNPLATKLFIGQVHALSLPRALAQFKAARDRPVEELLNYIYTNAWQALDPICRQVLQALLLVTEEGGRLAQIAAAAELDEADAATCLQRLVSLSLVNVGGDLQARHYSLHQLTQTFLARQSSEDNS